MIDIEWTEDLPSEHGYWLLQLVHKPKDFVLKRADMEQGPQLIYVDFTNQTYKECEMGIWRDLPKTRGDWKAEYSTECLDLKRKANFDY